MGLTYDTKLGAWHNWPSGYEYDLSLVPSQVILRHGYNLRVHLNPSTLP